MTNINIYCLFDGDDRLHGVYSSIKAVHRDAVQLCNKGTSAVYMRDSAGSHKPSVTLLRNVLKGEMDVKVRYFSDAQVVTILKTGLKE
jgi:hypothetical protein